MACSSPSSEGAGLTCGGPALAAAVAVAALVPCSLCETDGGLLVYRNAELRVIQASEAGFPAFYRVVWNRHVSQFSDLSAAERETCMHAVVVVEKVLSSELQPVRVNLAALGNLVAHLHWHVIARFDWDSHFPAPVWAAPQRQPEPAKVAEIASRCIDINRLIAEKMAL